MDECCGKNFMIQDQNWTTNIFVDAVKIVGLGLTSCHDLIFMLLGHLECNLWNTKVTECYLIIKTNK